MGRLRGQPRDQTPNQPPPPERGPTNESPAQAGDQKVFRDMLWELQTLRKMTDALRLLAISPTLNEVQAFADRVQMGMLETVDAIADRSLSFARFGDGEIRLMLRPEYKLAFQRNSPKLSAELHRVLGEGPTSPDLLVGFPHVYRDVHWSGVWADVWSQLRPLLGEYQSMGNSHVTRPIFFDFTGELGVAAWRRVWGGRHVVIVTGKGSRFELIPDLFDNVADVAWLHSTPRNAFDDLERVTLEAQSLPKGALFLVALGPSGTVLSARLAALGRRAIDLGHISDSYQAAFRGGAWPESKPTSK